MKILVLMITLFAMPAFAGEEIVENAVNIDASKPHTVETTRVERARYHFDRLHHMLSEIEEKRPLQPLPPMTMQDAMNVQIEVNVGDDVSISRR